MAIDYRDLVLIKWITCHTDAPEAFDHGQRSWAGLRGLPGFLGQGGGWSRREPGLAHAFGFWADRPSYDTFMAEAHDRIATAAVDTYHSIEVRIFERCLDIGGRFPVDFAGTSLVRLAHCHVRASCQEHFIGAQADVWNPGMAGAAGMRGGVFARCGETEFLVLSSWLSAPDHDRYLNERFPGLRQRSGAADDLESVTGDLIDLEAAWTVPV